MKNKSYLVGFILNLVTMTLALIGLIVQLVESKSAIIFVYYTILSNTLAIIISFIFSIYYGINTFIKRVKLPTWLSIVKYIDVTMLFVTFLTVVFILSWTTDYTLFELLTKGSMLYHHTLVPLITIIGFIFYEKHYLKPFWFTFIPMIVTLIYAVVFVILDLCSVMEAPYPFLKFTVTPLYIVIPSIIVVLGLVYGGAFLFRLLNQKFSLVDK